MRRRCRCPSRLPESRGACPTGRALVLRIEPPAASRPFGRRSLTPSAGFAGLRAPLAKRLPWLRHRKSADRYANCQTPEPPVPVCPRATQAAGDTQRHPLSRPVHRWTAGSAPARKRRGPACWTVDCRASPLIPFLPTAPAGAQRARCAPMTACGRPPRRGMEGCSDPSRLPWPAVHKSMIRPGDASTHPPAGLWSCGQAHRASSARAKAG